MVGMGDMRCERERGMQGGDGDVRESLTKRSHNMSPCSRESRAPPTRFSTSRDPKCRLGESVNEIFNVDAR